MLVTNLITGGFLPTDLGAKLRLWLSSGLATQTGLGNLIDYPDKSLNVNTATLGSGSVTIDPTGINGRQSLTIFDPNMILTSDTSAFSTDESRTVFAVIKADSDAGGSIFTNRQSVSFCQSEIGSDNSNIVHSSGSNNAFLTANPSIGGVSLIVEWGIVIGQLPTVKINGVSKSVTGSVIDAETGTAGYIVCSAGAYQGKLGDIIGIAGTDSYDCDRVRKYLATEFGITL